jgi:hypothetical protein
MSGQAWGTSYGASCGSLLEAAADPPDGAALSANDTHTNQTSPPVD